MRRAFVFPGQGSQTVGMGKALAEMSATAREVFDLLAPHLMCDYDETQAIGRRYRRQDEVGTPVCVTVDFDTLEDRSVTVRDRDSMEQVRVPIDDLLSEVRSRLT